MGKAQSPGAGHRDFGLYSVELVVLSGNPRERQVDHLVQRQLLSWRGGRARCDA
jgi:hypothetical protein